MGMSLHSKLTKQCWKKNHQKMSQTQNCHFLKLRIYTSNFCDFLKWQKNFVPMRHFQGIFQHCVLVNNWRVTGKVNNSLPKVNVEYVTSGTWWSCFLLAWLLTWKLPGVEETPKGLLCMGDWTPPGGDGVRIEELLGILKLGRFLVKLCKKGQIILDVTIFLWFTIWEN